MDLSSGIQKRFKKLFVLDEEGLRRIDGVLSKAAAGYSERLAVVFRVEREDDRFYETSSIDEVLADPNVPTRRIRLLGVELRKAASSNQPLNARDRIGWVVFDKDEPPMREPDVRVRIACADKTWALMLADELEPQIERLFKVKAFPAWIVLLFVPPVGLIAYRAARYFGASISSGLRQAVVAGLVLALAYAVAGFYMRNVAEGTPRLFRRLSDDSVFLWGDELTAFADREAFRRNVVWVVGVGFLVSFAAGVATLLL